MNKKIYTLFAFVLFGSLLLSSCLNDDDDNNIDQTWYDYQNNLFQEVAKDVSYTELKSESGNGSVYWRPSSMITDSDIISERISPQGTPNFTDTVLVRYEGWYLDINGEKKIFDSTENPSLSNSLNPNKVEVKLTLNVDANGFQLTDGFSTLLQDMTVGEERQVVIPQQLGYGSSAQTYIPAYTTLYFDVKLFKIISLAGRD